MNSIKQKFTAIFLAGFILSFSVAISAYVDSTFLSTYIPEKFVGLFYVISYILTIFLMIRAKDILDKIGNYKAILVALIINLISLIFLSFWANLFVVVISLSAHFIAITIIFFNLDVFLEAFSSDSSTGQIRGSYLSLINLAWLISPIIVGFILSDNEYWKVYLLSGILMIPVIYILMRNLKNFTDPKYEKTNIKETLKVIYKRKNVSKIFWAKFLLSFFYSWMVIYTPIYLHDHIGFTWSNIGIIFTMMLLPFILLEAPLGRLADKKLGEKEILNTGFLIIGISTATLAFITSHNIILWGLLLSMTRVGASMVEISSESYFFKKIDGGDTNILNLFRITNPLAYIFGPIIASILLAFIDINYLFVALGGIVAIGGIIFEITLKDTK